ncbi:kynureninase [Stackebrandtia soli]|uniref:kynureninase n=1 Tax=Stackebrandtia soli TaxID=1892856 RepID=UPI0039E8AA97
MYPRIDADSDPAALDAADPLAGYRDLFALDDAELVYLDGNSLGRPPRAVAKAVAELLDGTWRTELVAGWDSWVDLPTIAGDELARSVLGASPGEVLVADSTSANLYKLAAAALAAATPDRRVLVTDDDNFPTDRYILAGIAEQFGATLRIVRTDIDTGVDPEAVAAAVGADTAVVCLSHVAYRSGALADMERISAIARDAGAFTLWDLCHSAGSVPVELNRCGVDLAVGCTYKYLNAGPGAPAFLYVRKDLQSRLRQPMWGWFGQTDQFAMGPEYRPVEDIRRFSVGTPPISGITAVRAALEPTSRAGIGALREKSVALTTYALALIERRLVPLGFRVATPRDPNLRGGHVTIEHAKAWQISQAMRRAGIVPDYRAPNRVRLGFAPLYNGFGEIARAVEGIADIVASGAYVEFDDAVSRVT